MQTAYITFVDGNWVGMFNGKKVVKSYDQTRVVKMMAKAGHANAPIEGADVAKPVDKQAAWPINQRFDFVTQLVDMVAKGLATSVVVTGPGGLGKTHTVRAALQAAGLKEVDALEGVSAGSTKSFLVVKGYSTAKGLYRTLFEANGSTIVFDDCDDVMKDPVALNLLKGALDSYDKRVISWNADMKDDELPKSFAFTGRVVFISNMKRDSINNALLTRAYSVDLAMTTEQKLERMEVLLNSDTFMQGYTTKHKQDAMELIRTVGERANELSLRTLQAVTKIRAAGGNWKALAEYSLTN